MKEEILDAFTKAVSNDVAHAAIENFSKAEESLAFGDWTKVGFYGGHFAEAIYRLLEFQLDGSFTPIGKSLSPLNETRLQKFSAKVGSDSLRFHVPRSIFVIYGIRNKRALDIYPKKLRKDRMPISS